MPSTIQFFTPGDAKDHAMTRKSTASTPRARAKAYMILCKNYLQYRPPQTTDTTSATGTGVNGFCMYGETATLIRDHIRFEDWYEPERRAAVRVLVNCSIRDMVGAVQGDVLSPREGCVDGGDEA